jgi:uncharacterized membrane protein
MTDRPNPNTPPIVAGPARRVFHTLLAIAGWAVFIYWWWIVFHRVSRHEVRFTAVFIAISLAVIVLATLAWAWHNLRIFERKGPRTAIRDTKHEFTHDGVGRPVSFPPGGPDRTTAPVIYVRWTEEGKRYDPSASLPARESGGPTRAASDRAGT